MRRNGATAVNWSFNGRKDALLGVLEVVRGDQAKGADGGFASSELSRIKSLFNEQTECNYSNQQLQSELVSRC
jgi:hypothetical protein